MIFGSSWNNAVMEVAAEALRKEDLHQFKKYLVMTTDMEQFRTVLAEEAVRKNIRSLETRR